MASLTPEQQARETIDAMLVASGWVVQDIKAMNVGASTGVAVREYPTDTGPADYILFVDRKPVGVVEAKKADQGEKLTVHEDQAEGYAGAKLKWTIGDAALPFCYLSTGAITKHWDKSCRGPAWSSARAATRASKSALVVPPRLRAFRSDPSREMRDPCSKFDLDLS